MAKTIVFFNLADMNENGLAKTTVDSLRRKYPSYSYIYELWAGKNQVYKVDLFGLLANDSVPRSGVAPIDLRLLPPRLSSMPEIARERFAISILCSQASKIMLGVHGTHNNTDEGFAGMGWDADHGVVGNVAQFAKLVGSFLSPRQNYKLALVMCFGARSVNYRVDHDGVLSAEDVRSSFAYKFFKAIGTHGNITMTALTGSVAFDESTGRSKVQTEAAVNAEIEDHEIQHAGETGLIAREHEALEERMRHTKEGNDAFLAMRERMKVPVTIPMTPEEHIIRRHVDVLRRVNLLKAESNKMVSKYGKFIYTYNAGTSTATVSRKYEGGQKVMRVLYRGAL